MSETLTIILTFTASTGEAYDRMSVSRESDDAPIERLGIKGKHPSYIANAFEKLFQAHRKRSG